MHVSSCSCSCCCSCKTYTYNCLAIERCQSQLLPLANGWLKPSIVPAFRYFCDSLLSNHLAICILNEPQRTIRVYAAAELHMQFNKFVLRFFFVVVQLVTA